MGLSAGQLTEYGNLWRLLRLSVRLALIRCSFVVDFFYLNPGGTWY